jgi:hypothetical protein
VAKVEVDDNGQMKLIVYRRGGVAEIDILKVEALFTRNMNSINLEFRFTGSWFVLPRLYKHAQALHTTHILQVCCMTQISLGVCSPGIRRSRHG